MSVLFVLVPLAIAIVAVAIVAFLWATRRGQFDDLETPALRMLGDDEGPVSPRPSDAPGTPPAP